jgi:thioredoxin-dependent peroxiredoxin
MLEAGVKAPDFTLKNQRGEEVSLSDFKGQKVVVYFYPKDNTPGCTKEACSIRDSYTDIQTTGAVVLGISADSVKSHAGFAQKHELPFHLLSDPEKSVIKAYGAWGEKKMAGKSYEGIIRSTFVIDEQGIISKVFKKVKTAEHGTELLEAM